MRRTIVVALLTTGLLGAIAGTASAEPFGCALQRKLGIKNVMACDWDQG